jgi:hypothetical protein
MAVGAIDRDRLRREGRRASDDTAAGRIDRIGELITRLLRTSRRQAGNAGLPSGDGTPDGDARLEAVMAAPPEIHGA